jgi:hypothetical protein
MRAASLPGSQPNAQKIRANAKKTPKKQAKHANEGEQPGSQNKQRRRMSKIKQMRQRENSMTEIGGKPSALCPLALVQSQKPCSFTNQPISTTKYITTTAQSLIWIKINGDCRQSQMPTSNLRQ